MSSQQGNISRQRPQKFQNVRAFKNTLHDTSKKTKTINSVQVGGCCSRCKDIIEWKIKYKKFKPLTIPKKCVRCGQKEVKKAYCMVCQPCGEKYQICIKCGKNEDIVSQIGITEEEKNKNKAQLEQELKYLSERKRRTFLRSQQQGKLAEGGDHVLTEGATSCEASAGDEGFDDLCSSDDDDDGGDGDGDDDGHLMAQSDGLVDNDAKCETHIESGELENLVTQSDQLLISPGANQKPDDSTERNSASDAVAI